MKKILYFALPLLVTACGGEAKQETEAASTEVDSAAQIETQQSADNEAQAQAEQARIDSLRQDSIAQAEKMNLGTKKFIINNNWPKTLEKFGFKLVSKKKEKVESEFEGQPMETYVYYKYSRDINGKKVTFDCQSMDGWNDYDATMVIKDDQERKQFIDDIKKLGVNIGGDKWHIYNDGEHFISVNGNKIIFEREH